MNPRWPAPFFLVVPFSALITGLFNLSEAMPKPVALLVGAAWGAIVGLIAQWIRKRPRRAAWTEDALVVLGTVGFAFAGCGGLMAILLLRGALNGDSLTGEALEQMFLPSIPYYITVNSVLEILIIPLVVCLCWPGGPPPACPRDERARHEQGILRITTHALTPATAGYPGSPLVANVGEVATRVTSTIPDGR